jgi:hypothetical protein
VVLKFQDSSSSSSATASCSCRTADSLERERERERERGRVLMGGLEVPGFIFNLICSSFLQLQNSDFPGDIFLCILLSNSGNSL